MSSRLRLVDAIHQLQASGMELEKLWQAINDKGVEVIAQRLATLSPEVSHHHRADFPRWPDEGGVYLDAHRLDHPTGFIEVAELKELPNGFTRVSRPPFWWINRSGDNFDIYSHRSNPSGDDTYVILVPSFVRSALVLDDGSCIVDDFNALTRIVAHQVTVRARDIRSLLGLKAPRSHKRSGPKDNYECEECDSKLVQWARQNPSFDYDDKIKKFREVYAAHKHKLLQDKQFRREKAALERLGFISPAKARRQKPN